MLAPAHGASPHYRLYIDADLNAGQLHRIGQVLESHLATGHHYATCRRLGQLGALQVQHVRHGWQVFSAPWSTLASGRAISNRRHWMHVATGAGIFAKFGSMILRDTDDSGLGQILKQPGLGSPHAERDADFFNRLAEQQSPNTSGSGARTAACQPMKSSDWTLAKSLCTGMANLVLHTDMNCLSVIQFAVEVLKVRHVMVVGHYGCGGVQAVLDRKELGLVDGWLRHVEDLRYIHAKRIDSLADPRQRADRLCEINVIEQVVQVSRLTSVLQAWRRGQPLSVHGGFMACTMACCAIWGRPSPAM